MDEYIESIYAGVFNGRTRTAGIRIHSNSSRSRRNVHLSDDPVSCTDIAFWDSCCNRDFYEYYFARNLVQISNIFGMIRYFIDIADYEIKMELFIDALIHLGINSVSVWVSKDCTGVCGYDVSFKGSWEQRKRRGPGYKCHNLKNKLVHYGFYYCGANLWTLYLQFIKNEIYENK